MLIEKNFSPFCEYRSNLFISLLKQKDWSYSWRTGLKKIFSIFLNCKFGKNFSFEFILRKKIIKFIFDFFELLWTIFGLILIEDFRDCFVLTKMGKKTYLICIKENSDELKHFLDYSKLQSSWRQDSFYSTNFS